MTPKKEKVTSKKRLASAAKALKKAVNAAAREKKSTGKRLNETEVEAYEFVRAQLKSLGWNTKNPSTSNDGQVWTQNQCLAEPAIKAALGSMRPENIIKVTEKYLWIIEAKTKPSQIDLALDEAINEYAKRINDYKGIYEAAIATGVAGNVASGFVVRTKIRVNGKWKPLTINNNPATGFLAPSDVVALLKSGGSDIHAYAPPQRLFLEAAERINEILHAGGIDKEVRARTIAALLLSVIDEPPNLETSLPVLIAEINARTRAVLTENGKADFAPFVELLTPTSKTTHPKRKRALVKTIQELQNLNIPSAMNSSTDVLGQFYEVFLKYGNGAKDLGIVLTPRHVTRFAVEAVGVSIHDIILDPACGTGGFLVAAFDKVRGACSPSQLEDFKKYNLFGIEEKSYLAALAIVNMIFRGDGKHNITEGDCFKTFLVKKTVDGNATAAFVAMPAAPGKEPVTRVLMNPPFASPDSHEKEYHFVTHALGLMADGGVLFALLPLGNMFRTGDDQAWRRNELLAKHTLLAAITLPEHLFAPAAQKQVMAVIVKKGIPHAPEHPVFWGRVMHDGYVVVKSQRLPAEDFNPPRQEPNELAEILPKLRGFLDAPTSTKLNVPEFYKTAPIDFSDPLLELVPEAYLDSRTPSKAEIVEAVQSLARDTAAFLVKFEREEDADEYDDKN